MQSNIRRPKVKNRPHSIWGQHATWQQGDIDQYRHPNRAVRSRLRRDLRDELQAL